MNSCKRIRTTSLVTVLLSVLVTGVLTAQTVSDQTLVPKTDHDWTTWNATWQPKTGKFNGRDIPTAQIEPIILTIESGVFRIDTPGFQEKGKLVFGQTTSANEPQTLDVVIEQGPNAGTTLKAICKLTDDKLTICYAMDSGQRPTVFESTEENKALLLEYERKNP